MTFVYGGFDLVPSSLLLSYEQELDLNKHLTKTHYIVLSYISVLLLLPKCFSSIVLKMLSLRTCDVSRRSHVVYGDIVQVRPLSQQEAGGWSWVSSALSADDTRPLGFSSPGFHPAWFGFV